MNVLISTFSSFAAQFLFRGPRHANIYTLPIAWKWTEKKLN